MKNVLWVVLLVTISVVMLMITLTFMQPEFRQEVGANFLFLQSRRIPVYTFVFGAFIAGVLLGSLPLLAAYAKARREVSRKTGVIRELEAKLESLKDKEAAGEIMQEFPGSSTSQPDKESA